MQKTSEYEQELLKYASEKLSTIEGLKIYGTSEEKEPLVSFLIEDRDVTEMEKYLSDEHNIDVRGGTMSAEPLMKTLRVKGLLQCPINRNFNY